MMRISEDLLCEFHQIFPREHAGENLARFGCWGTGVVVIMDNWEEARKAKEEAPWAEEGGGDPSVLETS